MMGNQQPEPHYFRDVDGVLSSYLDDYESRRNMKYTVGDFYPSPSTASSSAGIPRQGSAWVDENGRILITDNGSLTDYWQPEQIAKFRASAEGKQKEKEKMNAMLVKMAKDMELRMEDLEDAMKIRAHCDWKERLMDYLLLEYVAEHTPADLGYKVEEEKTD